MKLSLIIPIYNETLTIQNCLQNLRQVQGIDEVIFADGGSTDDTLIQIGVSYRVIHCPKGRAKQMNAAAKEADGDILWFSHCDSQLPSDAGIQIKDAVRHGAKFGCFHIGFDYDGPFMGCNTYFSNRRAKKSHIAFGDQGIFIAKELFLQEGGFPDLPIMEDYEFSRRLKRKKIPLTVLPGRIITSGRR
ncbi:MAG: TIGR04283 family arsenosugar biosynthesis glycosyltransferase, partial [Oscillospiraceae bacterium]|nr:TIGR04283 family arsenosugar biosynthesis glycosyltransferase [Oscillospiraceae bacterium]